MTPTALVEIGPPPVADPADNADEVIFFDGLEAATQEAQTGCGDDNPYR